MNIYEITNDLMELQALLLEAPDDESLNDTLESVMYDFEMKSDGYCKVIRNLQADVDAYANEIKRLQQRKTATENAIDRLKKTLNNALLAIGKDKVKGELFTVSLRKSGKQLPKDLNGFDIPKEYMIPQPDKIDRVNLLKDVKNGKVDIPLVENKNLQIK